MSEDRAPQIRGVVRAELVADLAIGELSHDQLAEKFGRSRHAIDQFSSRNRDEIRLAKQEMSAEDQGLLYAKKRHRIALLEQWLADVENRLQDSDLTDTARKGFINTGLKLVHSIADQKGELPSRIAIEADTPLLQYTISGIDMEKVFAEGDKQRHIAPASDQTFTPEPAPAPNSAPAPVPEPTREESAGDPDPKLSGLRSWLNS